MRLLMIMLATMIGMSAHARVPNKPNRLTVLGGYGPDARMHSSSNANEVLTTHSKDVVVGLLYQRKVTDSVSISGQALSNETFLLGVGRDF